MSTHKTPNAPFFRDSSTKSSPPRVSSAGRTRHVLKPSSSKAKALAMCTLTTSACLGPSSSSGTTAHDPCSADGSGPSPSVALQYGSAPPPRPPRRLLRRGPRRRRAGPAFGGLAGFGPAYGSSDSSDGSISTSTNSSPSGLAVVPSLLAAFATALAGGGFTAGRLAGGFALPACSETTTLKAVIGLILLLAPEVFFFLHCRASAKHSRQLLET